MSRFALIGRQFEEAAGPLFTPKWNKRRALTAADGVKLINYSIKPNRNATKEEGLHTMSYSFIAGGVFKPDGSLEGYYRCDSNVGNGIIKAVFGSEFKAPGGTAEASHPLTSNLALKYGSVEFKGVVTTDNPTGIDNRKTFTLSKDTYAHITGDVNNDTAGGTGNCYVYYLGNEIWPYTMRLIEDGPADSTTHFNEFKNVLFQNLTLTFDTREFPKFKVDFIAGPSRNALDSGETGIDAPTFTNNKGIALTASPTSEMNYLKGTTNESKPAAFYNAVIETSTDNFASAANTKTLGCKSLTLNVTRKFDENYVYIGSPFLSGAAINGVSEVSGNFTTGAGLDEYNLFDSIFHDAANTSNNKKAAGEILQDTNAMNSFSLRFALFDTDFRMIGFFTAGTAVLTEGSKNIQGRQVIERTINFQCYGEAKTMCFYVPKFPIIGIGGELNDPPQQFTGAFKGLAKEYAELAE